MNLIDDHHFRTGAFEIEKAALALDEIETDNRERISFEDACRIGKVPFEPGGRRSRDRRRRDGELGLQFVRPLLHQMRRAQDRETTNLAAVEHLAQDQSGFYRLADADIIGDKQADRLQAQRHHERRQLIGARLEVDPACTSERTGATAQGKAKGIPEKLRRIPPSRALRIGSIETCVGDRLALKLRQDRLDFSLGARERPQGERRVGFDHNPFPAARPDKLAW